MNDFREILSTISENLQRLKRLIIIFMNVNVVTNNFEHGINHWVGLVINADDNRKISLIQYVDPMGFGISADIEGQVKRQLGLNKPNFKIKEFFNAHNRPQYANIIQDELRLSDDSDMDNCGPFLVYTLAMIAQRNQGHIPPFKTNTKQESLLLGQACRNFFQHKDRQKNYMG